LACSRAELFEIRNLARATTSLIGYRAEQLALLMAHRLDQALAASRRAVMLEPKEARAYCSLGHVLIQKGRLDDASNAFREAARLEPKLAVAYWGLGEALRKQIAYLQYRIQTVPALALGDGGKTDIRQIVPDRSRAIMALDGELLPASLFNDPRPDRWGLLHVCNTAGSKQFTRFAKASVFCLPQLLCSTHLLPVSVG